MARTWLITILLTIALAGACSPMPVPAPPSDDPDKTDWPSALGYVFDESELPEIHIKVQHGEWDKLLAEYDKNPNTKEFIRCDANFIKAGELTRLPSSGLRLRGNTSRRRPQASDGRMQHCHYRLDFHHYEKNGYHTLKGLRSVDLKWFKDDPAYVREVFCYDLFKQFGVWTAIHDVYSRLWITIGDGQEKYLGIYGLLEHINKDYLSARKEQFGSAEGYLWKCGYTADLNSTERDFGIDDNGRDHCYALKTNKESFEQAKKDLCDFITKLREPISDSYFRWLESRMDIDLLLRTYAVNVAVGMWDDYWNNANNYYLYFTPEGKVFFIPFDYDNTLGTSLKCGVQSDSGRQDPYNWGMKSNILMYKVLQNATWRKQYRQYLIELCRLSGPCGPAMAQERILRWQERIRPYVANDTGEDMVIEDRPAPWGNHPEYRLLKPGSDNFFEVKSAVVSSMKL
ncbi:MAG: CotH kinase family protein [Bacteroidales bacterium]|nr:CotH kinase family protein [Bacteroidales bacterium]